WRAAKQAGLKQVPCLIKRVDDRAAIAMALIENIQREDLNAIEEAQALERLQDEFKLTHQQVADVIGKSRTTVSNLLRLNQLDDAVKRLVESKQLEMGHARSLLVLPIEQQQPCAQVMVDKQLTVRQAESLVKRWSSEAPAAPVSPV
ncbi:ParB/RepB/Spo0J family partition protein, partial [Guyparkeria sp. 1SP6A2]|nr:ParB/RepB/Spo0J family partition protein [Guyparkeria sp. 1SP6A2]